jgi:hypothetical protein
MPDTSPKNDISAVATGLGAAITVFSAGIGVFGALTGGLARLSRNYPWIPPLALGLVVAAVLCSLLAARLNPADDGNPDPAPKADLTPPDHAAARQDAQEDSRRSLRATRTRQDNRRQRQQRLLVASVILFGFSLVVPSAALASTIATVDRPRITAKWVTSGPQALLSGTVASSGMKTHDKMFVTVVRLLDNGNHSAPTPPPSPDPTWAPTVPPKSVYWAGIVYQQTTGPDIDGNVSVTFEVPAPHGYPAMLVVASVNESRDSCPPTQPEPAANKTPQQSLPPGTASPAAEIQSGVAEPEAYACLILDAPQPNQSR